MGKESFRPIVYFLFDLYQCNSYISSEGISRSRPIGTRPVIVNELLQLADLTAVHYRPTVYSLESPRRCYMVQVRTHVFRIYMGP